MEINQEKRDFTEDVEVIKPIIEALIFASPEPLNIKQLTEIIDGAGRDIIRAALSQLKEEYRQKERGIMLLEISDGFHFRTRPQYKDYIVKLTKTKPVRLTQSSLETLAIIAYKQPIIKAEIEDIRGVDSGYMIKSLLEKRLIKIIGKKDIVGRPLLYGTTKEFLDVFSLKDLSSLPTLKDIKELGSVGNDDSQLSLL